MHSWEVATHLLSQRRFKKRWLIPPLTGLVMVLVIGGRLEVIQSYRNQALQKAAETTAGTAEALGERIAHALDQADHAMLLAIASQGERFQRDPQSARSAPAVHPWRDSDPPDVQFYDAHGRPVEGGATVSLGAREEMGRRALAAQRAAPQRAMHLGDLTKDGSRDEWLLPVSRAVFDEAGKVLGFLAVGIRLDAVLAGSQRAGLGPGGIALLLHDDGRTITRWPANGSAPSPGGPPAALLSGPDLRQLDSTGWPDGVERMVSAVRVEKLPLRVMVGVSRSGVLADWNYDLWRLIINLVFSIPLAVWLTWFALRQLTLRDKSLAAVAQAERRLRDIVDGSLQGLIVHRGGWPIYASHRAAEILGYSSAAELTALDSLDRIIAPEELPRLRAHLHTRAEGGSAPEVYEYKGLRKDGSSYWAETRVRQIIWDGEPATLATVFDVTERHQAEEDLRVSQRLLRTVFDAIPHVLYVKGIDRRFLMVNQTMANTWRINADEIVGRTVSRPDLRIDEEEAAIRRLDDQVFATGQAVDQVITRTLPGGAVIRSRQIKVPVRNAAGEVIGLVGLGEDVTARMAADEMLKSQQRLMEKMINSLPHAIFVKGMDGRFVMVNNANAKLNGLQPADIIGKRLSDLPASRRWDVERLAAMDRELIETKRPVESGNMTFHLPDGTVQTRRMIKVPLVDDEGLVTGIMSISEDVTERLRSEQALRDSERRFKDFTEAASDWFWEMDADLRYVAIVGRTYSDRIQDPADIFGKTAWGGSYPPEEAASRYRLRQLMEAHQPVRGMVLRVYARDNTIHTIRYNGIPVLDADGRFQGYRGTGTDITEEMAARQRADLAYARLTDAVAALPAGFMLWDAQSRLVLWNNQVADLVPASASALKAGLAYREFVEHAIREVAEDQVADREAWIENRVQAFLHSVGYTEVKFKDGRWLRLVERRTSEGGTVSLRFDVTEAKQRETELRQAQKMDALGQLTGGVAHDFNNLMQVILGYVALALRSTPADDPRREMMSQIRAAGQRAADLTLQLLAFSRKQVMRPVTVDLNTIIADQASMLRRLLGARVHLDTRLYPALEVIVADRGMLEQVIMNLVINARDAMPQGGTITLSTEHWDADDAFCRHNPWAVPGRYALMRCIDTGIGMSAHVREHAFEPFFTTKAPGQGTGLGLAMVYGITKQHSGGTQVRSEEGHGSEFIIYLPVQRATPVALKSARQPEELGHGQTILVAEDSDAVRDLIRQVLSGSGYRVLAANDGAQAVDLFQKHKREIDLVVLDIVMPVVGGLEAQETIAKSRPDVPILFSSGWYDERDQHVIESRGIRVIMKPYSAEELLAAVRDGLAGRQGA